MPRKLLSLSLAVLATCLFFGCDDKADSPTPGCFPAPRCYSGTVVAFTCHDGFLIQVDAQYPIGKHVRLTTGPDSLASSNVIAAVNSLGALGVQGQRVYFTCEYDANQQVPSWPCNAMYAWVTLPVPHLVLGNVSATACGPVVP